MTTENGEPTIILGSGTVFDYRCPEEATLTIEDIAYGLASCSRFAGQAISRRTGRRVRYNVAEHCVRMSEVCRPEIAYPTLMHELGEPTCGDLPAPLKKILPEFAAIEKRCEAAALAAFEVPMSPEVKAEIKLLDLRMCVTEKLFLRPASYSDAARAVDRKWDAATVPLDIEIVDPWGFEEAAERFLRRFAEVAPAHIAEREGCFTL